MNFTCSMEGVDEVGGDVIPLSVMSVGSCMLSLPDFLLCCVGVISLDDEISGVTTLLCMAAFRTDID